MDDADSKVCIDDDIMDDTDSKVCTDDDAMDDADCKVCTDYKTLEDRDDFGPVLMKNVSHCGLPSLYLPTAFFSCPTTRHCDS